MKIKNRKNNLPKSIILSICMVILLMSTCFANTFVDVQNHWAKQKIEKLVRLGIVNGYKDNTFRPSKNITRAEFIALINKAYKFQSVRNISYKDVSNSHWFYEDLRKAKFQGYITGYEDNTIRPNNYITRQEVAVIMSRVMNVQNYKNQDVLKEFKDHNSIADWSKGSLAALVDKKYINGYEDKTLRPNTYITRAESASILFNKFKGSGGGAYIGKNDTKKTRKLKSSETNTRKDDDSNKVDYITLDKARKQKNSTIVKVQGVVTSIIGNNAFIQDGTAGIYVYAGKNPKSELKVGNTVKIEAEIAEFSNLKQIKNIKSIELIKENSKLPKPKTVELKDINDNLEGQLVKIEGATIESVGSGSSGYSITVNSKGNSIKLRVDKYLKPYIKSDKFHVGDTVTVTAPVGQFHENYQLILRSIDDVVVTKASTGETKDALEGLKIRDIQGTSHKSSYVGKQVSSVKGIVTGIENKRGFYIQDPKPDNDDKTSEGIYVSSEEKVQMGDEVAVSGKVEEKGYKSNLSITRIKAEGIKTISKNNKLPEAVVIGKGGRTQPSKIIDNDNFAKFDPEEDAIDFYESLEGMRVKINNPIIVGADERYGETYVLADNGDNASGVRTSHNGIKLLKNDANPEIIIIDDIINPISSRDRKYIDPDFKLKVGDKFSDSIEGVVSYDYGMFKVLNTNKLPNIISSNLKREATTIKKKEEKLTIASYNLENFSAASNPKKIAEIGESIVKDLKCPDIIGLVEIQDNDGDKNSGETDASKTYEALIKAIKDSKGEDYSYTDIAPIDKKDGGKPGGNIRVGFIYNNDRVNLVTKQKGDTVTSAVYSKDGLNLNPVRIDPNNDCFSNSRKSLAVEFEFKGKNVIVIANHFSSKRGDDGLFGSKQPPVRGSEVNRHKQAEVVNKFIKEIKKVNPNANIVALGDLNDFEFSETCKILKGEEMTNMIDELNENERFTYTYKGNSQILDSILVSKNLKDEAKIDIVNINSEFTKGYGRVSDHDPVIIQIKLD